MIFVLNALVAFGGFTVRLLPHTHTHTYTHTYTILSNVSCNQAVLLVRSFVLVGRTEAHPNYATIGEEACGKWGKNAVNASCFIEFGVALLGFQIIIWQNVSVLLDSFMGSHAPQRWVIVLACVCVTAPTSRIR